MLQINNYAFRFLIRKLPMLLVLCISFFCFCNNAWAGKSYTITLVNAPVIVTMGDAAGTILTYRITNTNTGGDIGDSINILEFNLNAPYSWSASTTAPSGWTITTRTATKIIFSATSDTIPPKIPLGSSQNFNLVLGSIPSGIQDSSDLLSSVIATYDDTKKKTYNNPASSAWTRKSLSVDSFTAVDSVSGIAASSPGRTLTVTLTVTNRSTSNWTGIVSNPQPPTTTITWTSGSTTITTGSNPNINLNAGQTGTLVWTYTIGSNCTVATPPAGSVYFSITNLRNSTNIATSKSATSNIVSIGCFTGALSLNSTCISNNTNITITMTLANRYAQNITGLSATLIPAAGGATETLISGPSYSTTTLTGGGGTATVTWVYRITGNAGDAFSFTGTASGTLQTSPTKAVAASITPSPTGFIVSAPVVSVSPSILTVDKNRMVSVEWSFTNTLCTNVNRVAISLPAGWNIYRDPYDNSYGTATANTGAINEATDWTTSQSGNTIIFQAGTNLSLGNSGGFILFFDQIPTAQGIHIFPVSITDTAGGTTNLSNNITINPAGSGMKSPGPWREEFR